MEYTVFYSWQSDLPNSTNRSFIERAIKDALDEIGKKYSLQEADRKESLGLDKDTKGVPGTPPIADTIFSKISNCSIFVPDLTFVGKSNTGRPLPNPNVLIEYGWALKEVGHNRIIPIMNSSYGEPNDSNLPFDMKHLRRPLTYYITESSTSEEKSSARKTLTKKLAEAIELIIEKGLSNLVESFQEIQSSKDDISSYFPPAENINDYHIKDDNGSKFVLPRNQHLFLRLIPTISETPLSTSMDALKLLESSQLLPMYEGRCGGFIGRNSFGAYAAFLKDGRIRYISQLFKNREIWGIDTQTIDKEYLKKRGGTEFGFFPSAPFEKTFHFTLTNYLSFAKDVLKLIPPFRFIAGATGIKDYKMGAPPGMEFKGGFEPFDGNVFEENIVYNGRIESFSENIGGILTPFFELVWKECGLNRPNKEIWRMA